MPQITFNFTDQNFARMQTAFSVGYQSKLTQEDGTEIDNPDTVAQFAKKQVKELILNYVRNYEAKQAKDTAVKNLNPITSE
jgi:hypothetical protein